MVTVTAEYGFFCSGRQLSTGPETRGKGREARSRSRLISRATIAFRAPYPRWIEEFKETYLLKHDNKPVASCALEKRFQRQCLSRGAMMETERGEVVATRDELSRSERVSMAMTEMRSTSVEWHARNERPTLDLTKEITKQLYKDELEGNSD